MAEQGQQWAAGAAHKAAVVVLIHCVLLEMHGGNLQFRACHCPCQLPASLSSKGGANRLAGWLTTTEARELAGRGMSLVQEQGRQLLHPLWISITWVAFEMQGTCNRAEGVLAGVLHTLPSPGCQAHIGMHLSVLVCFNVIRLSCWPSALRWHNGRNTGNLV